MQQHRFSLVLMVLCASTWVARVEAAASPPVDPALGAAIADPARTAAFVARDGARHPAAELTFFGLKPTETVVELWPGGGYWTEILGRYLAPKGTYFVALPPAGNAEEDAGVARWRSRIAAEHDRLGTIHETTLGLDHYEIAPAGSADLVLTFRNLHNWMNDGYAAEALAACFKALKPGGILGIEEHRGRLGDQRESARHQGLGGWRLDFATHALPRRQGQGKIPGRRRGRQFRAAVSQTQALINAAASPPRPPTRENPALRRCRNRP
jgi:predicted methyltransferase